MSERMVFDGARGSWTITRELRTPDSSDPWRFVVRCASREVEAFTFPQDAYARVLTLTAYERATRIEHECNVCGTWNDAREGCAAHGKTRVREERN